MTPSNVLGFEFENGNILYLRPSGTEPKIKFYTMVQVQEGDLATKKLKAQEMRRKKQYTTQKRKVNQHLPQSTLTR